MINRNPQSKHLPGVVPAVDHWFENRPATRSAARNFTAASGMVPTNPLNYRAAFPQPGTFAYDTMAQGLVMRSNPYGDGYSFGSGESPQLTTPAPAAAMIQAPPPIKNAELQLGTPGYGYAAGNPLARIDAAQRQQPPEVLGTSTSPTLAGSGPQRDVPRPS